MASNACLVIEDATVADFAVLTSRMHVDWVRAVGGRLKSDYRYSKDVIYNNFVFPEIDAEQQQSLEELGNAVLTARDTHGATLERLYDAGSMPADLRAAHREIDEYVDALYRAAPFDEGERASYLLELHQAREAGLLDRLTTPKRKRGLIPTRSQ